MSGKFEKAVEARILEDVQRAQQDEAQRQENSGPSKVFAPTQTFSDPRDEKGNLVDQSQIPTSREFVIAINQQEIDQQRVAIMDRKRSDMGMIEKEFIAYLDIRLLRNPRSVFTGPHFPYHFAWVEDFDPERAAAGERLTDTARQFREHLEFEGYRPVDFRKLGDMFVSGRDAAMLGISRKMHIIQALAAKRVPPPPRLPEHLFDKFGTVLPPVISQHGHYWVGRQRLYMVERTIMEQRMLDQRARSNTNIHVSDPSRNIIQQPGGGQGQRAEISLDDFFSRGRG